jgi:cellobiose-specific phosphotransferase system component IIC
LKEEEDEDGIMGLKAAGVNAMPLIIVGSVVSVTTLLLQPNLTQNGEWMV